MGGHDIVLAEMVGRALVPERERQMRRKLLIREAKVAKTGQIGEITWFGGIKATAMFLRDAARETFAQRRMTEAH